MLANLLTASALAVLSFLFILASAYAISTALCLTYPPLIHRFRTFLISFSIPLAATYFYLPSLSTPVLRTLSQLLP